MPSSRFIQERLSNGLTVVIEVMDHVPSAACGFLARTGARDDPPALAGVSHFLEHMCFKGTARRTWRDINVEFDSLGAQYNAFTSKDRTFYYSWVKTDDFDRQLDLLADMMQPSLPADEFATERQVVLEEIAMSNDDLASCAYDLLYAHVCAGTSLAWPVLGREDTIKAMSRDQMAAYYRQRYAPGNLVLVVAGRVDPARVMASAKRYCGGWPAVPVQTERQPPAVQVGTTVAPIDRFHQQAVLVAFPTAGAVHELNETAEAMAAILGGANSRIYWNIVQEGLSTRAGAFREEYGDFGLAVMYALCEPENCEEVLDALRCEAGQLTAQGPEPKELQRVKNLRRTALANESEAPYYRLGQLADDIDYRGAPRSAAERLAAVEAVTADTVAACLREFPITGPGFVVSIGPRDWKVPS